MTDLELIDKYIEQSRNFVPPLLFRDVERRGLGHIINYLPKDIKEAKAIARGRMAQLGQYFGDEEIDKIAGEINRLKFLRKQLEGKNLADADKVIPILEEMQAISLYIRDYYK